MHGTRWLTAIFALPVLFTLIAAGGPFFFFFLILGVAGIAHTEYHRIVDTRLPSVADGELRWITRMALAFVVLSGFWGMAGLTTGLFVGLLTLIAWCMLRFGKSPELLARIPFEVQGLLWVGLPLGCLGALRMGDHGIAWIFFTLFLVGSGDTGAYYAGRFFGKHKLAPAISPAKTLEGFAGGIVLTLIVALIFQLFFLSAYGLLPMLILALITAVVAPLGDLFESMQKRVAGVKDSGRLLPGHGGMLDRIDALLFAAPAVFLLKTLFFG